MKIRYALILVTALFNNVHAMDGLTASMERLTLEKGAVAESKDVLTIDVRPEHRYHLATMKALANATKVLCMGYEGDVFTVTPQEISFCVQRRKQTHGFLPDDVRNAAHLLYDALYQPKQHLFAAWFGLSDDDLYKLDAIVDAYQHMKNTTNPHDIEQLELINAAARYLLLEHLERMEAIETISATAWLGLEEDIFHDWNPVSLSWDSSEH